MKLARSIVVSLPLLALLSALSCGGQAVSTPGNSAGGNSGGNADGGNGGSGVAGAGVAGASSAVCSAPLVVGPCEAAIPSYWHDPKTGACIPFIYGGCSGNENRFATLKDCQTACNAVPGAIDACDKPSDCVLVPVCGCVPCQPSARTYVSVHHGGQTTYQSRPECLTVPCSQCPAPAPGHDSSLDVVATCSEGHCVPVDLREAGATSCATAEDCQLRLANGCCEACFGNQLLAVNHARTLESLVCDPSPRCPKCEVQYPTGYAATCVQQECSVLGPSN